MEWNEKSTWIFRRQHEISRKLYICSHLVVALAPVQESSELAFLCLSESLNGGSPRTEDPDVHKPGRWALS